MANNAADLRTAMIAAARRRAAEPHDPADISSTARSCCASTAITAPTARKDSDFRGQDRARHIAARQRVKAQALRHSRGVDDAPISASFEQACTEFASARLENMRLKAARGAILF